MNALKPFVTIKDSNGNNYKMEFTIERRNQNGVQALLLTGTFIDKLGGEVSVKIAREANGVFLGRHIRIIGNVITSPNEIAGQLNNLFAEE